MTHWLNDDKKVDAAAFYNQYLADKTTQEDKDLFSFKGKIEWIAQMNVKRKNI